MAHNKLGSYKCPCGVVLLLSEMRDPDRIRDEIDTKPCTATSDGRHTFTYIYPDGHPAIGPLRS